VDDIRVGTIGQAYDGVEVRIDPQTGEILMRGRNVFAGYLNQPEKTAETIDRRLAAHRRRGRVMDETATSASPTG
jgi:long-chain acyl-CoA synthetase